MILDFWATWCAPCVKEFPKFNRLIDVFEGRSVRFLSVTYEDSVLVSGFLERSPLDSWIGSDTDFSSYRGYSSYDIPVTFIIRNGQVLARIRPEHLTEELIEQALAGEPLDVGVDFAYYEPEKTERYFRKMTERGRGARWIGDQVADCTRLFARGDADSAKSLLVASLQRGLENEWLKMSTINNLGYQELGKGRRLLAVDVFQFNVASFPNDPNVHDSLGDAYEQCGQLDLARESYTLACSISESEGGAGANLDVYRANLDRVTASLKDE